MTSDYYVYTDGACVNNGQENAMAGMGIYFGDDDPRNVSKRVVGKQSNNTAELGAIIEAYTIIKDDLENGKVITIVSDSIYAIRCATTYGEKCATTGWSKDIPNKDMVRKAYETYKNINNVIFVHIKAHTGKDDIHSMGNDNADRLANLAIGVTQCPYSRVYLNVPFAEKEIVKAQGARWDPKKKQWWVNQTNMSQSLEKFIVR